MHRLPEMVALQIFELHLSLPFQCHMPEEQLPREQRMTVAMCFANVVREIPSLRERILVLNDSLRTFHLPAREAVNLATVAISKNSRNPGEFRNFRDSVQPFGNAQQDAQVLGLFSFVYRLQLSSIRGTIHLENDDC
jgi:hypothetical protein